MSDANATDERFMDRALVLAARGEGRVEPNPMVGCVLVHGSRIIGEGYHRRFGGPHAEVDALRRSTSSSRGSTAYVTLEPCNFFGKTPPCTAALLAAGVRRVVAAVRDPNPLVCGRGLTELRRGGVAVTEGVRAPAAAALIGPYTKLLKTGRPWVTLKWGQSLDGKLATRAGDAKWITDEAQRTHANRERGRFDAILVGIGTVLADDPSLTCRTARPRRIAARVVLDTRLRTPMSAKLVRTAKHTPTWIFCGATAPATKRRQLELAGCRVQIIRATGARSARVDPDAVLRVLGEARMTNLLVEGGGAMLGAFHDAGLADEVQIYIAPTLIGGRTAIGALDGVGPARLRDAISLASDEHRPALRRLGTGWYFRARLSSRARSRDV